MTEPYYAVIFTSNRTSDDQGYMEMAKLMENLAKEQPGYLGMESSKQEIGITVSYWKDLDAIANWKQNADHLLAQRKGISTWYERYTVRICLVEREYRFQRND